MVSRIKETGRCSLNSATPNAIDFQCDVMKAVEDEIKDKNLLIKVIGTYILFEDLLSQQDRTKIEQRLGKIFIARSLSPISKYFTTIKKGRKKEQGEK